MATEPKALSKHSHCEYADETILKSIGLGLFNVPFGCTSYRTAVLLKFGAFPVEAFYRLDGHECVVSMLHGNRKLFSLLSDGGLNAFRDPTQEECSNR